MTGYSYGNHQPAGAAILAQQLHHERQRSSYWEGRARAAESRPRAHNLPLTNAAGEVEEPLPTTSAEPE
ncbi:hypothetical protein [Specibacter sp. RAF43]|uniref:hypothetical protein n=1 Tax=Specibacter sp. RAF43 TaxID=3233057 RepID=UPI003F9A7B67